MQITHIASFLVSPGKNLENPPDVSGVMLPLTGRLYNMLNVVFENSDVECDIPIRFEMATDGSQNNEPQNHITTFMNKPNLATGEILAKRLRDFTTQLPGLALLFIILGNEENKKKLVLSRFPADEGIIADIHAGHLQVEYIERVFMKNKNYYKAALYKNFPRADLWSGYAVDKQIDKQQKEIADYWIFDFLASNFETTSKLATRRLAKALLAASSEKLLHLEVKEELIAFATLSRKLDGQRVSVRQLVERYNLSTTTRDVLLKQLPAQLLAEEIFLLDGEEFAQNVAYRTVEIDNGAILTAPQNQFDRCFSRKIIDDNMKIVEYTTQGQIADERMKGRK